MIRVYLALQEFIDGRIAFRRWSPDTEKLIGGVYQKQDIRSFRWFLEQSWNFTKFPIWSENYPYEMNQESMAKVEPFEIIK